MTASTVCWAADCPQLVQPKSNVDDPVFCSEAHLILYKLDEVLDALADVRGEPHREWITVANVSGPLPIRRSGAVW